jgi:hypothetical protein
MLEKEIEMNWKKQRQKKLDFITKPEVSEAKKIYNKMLDKIKKI